MDDDSGLSSDLAIRAAIRAHVEDHVGPVEGEFAEPIPGDLAVDVLFAGPTPEFPFRTLVTAGMSARPMAQPPGGAGNPFAELAFLLPPTWPVAGEPFQRPWSFWPVQVLKSLVRFAHETGTWLGSGQVLADEGDPPPPYAAGVPFNAVLLLPPVSLPVDFWHLRRLDRTVRFLALYPLFWDEYLWAQGSGVEALLGAFDRQVAPDVLDMGRKSLAPAARRRFLGWI